VEGGREHTLEEKKTKGPSVVQLIGRREENLHIEGPNWT